MGVGSFKVCKKAQFNTENDNNAKIICYRFKPRIICQQLVEDLSCVNTRTR